MSRRSPAGDEEMIAMRIAVTAKGPTLESPVEPKFGRCAHLLLVDGESGSFEALPNPFLEESGGAGSRLVGLISSHEVDLVLTGSPGPNAQVALEAAGIRTVTGCSGTVRAALEALSEEPTGLPRRFGRERR